MSLKTIILWALFLPFVFITYVIVWLDRKFRFALPFPRDIDELAKKQEWCIDKLKQNNVLPADTMVKSYEVIPLDQKFIFRSNAGVIIIQYTSGGQQKQLKCFAKFAPNVGTVWNRTIFNLQLNHSKESDFNRLFIAADKNIPAPLVYVSEISFSTGNLCLITEFMVDCMEHKDSIYKNFTPEQLEMVLNGLATLHAFYWNCKEERMKKVIAIEDSTLLLFDSLVKSKWSQPARSILWLSWKSMNRLQTVIHGDARIGNMMFPAAEDRGRFVLIDWQAVRQGMAVYDLAYFLLLSLTTERRQEVEEQCIVNYYNYLYSKGVTGYTFEELKHDYNHACLCVLVLLCLPYLSGEASAEDDGASLFAWGMGIWRDRLQTKFSEFNYTWLAQNYNLTQQQGKDAVAEMIAIIGERVNTVEKERMA